MMEPRFHLRSASMKTLLPSILAASVWLCSSAAWAQYDPQCASKAQYAQDGQQCDRERTQHFDKILNQSYQALMKQQTQAGKNRLRSMQRAWIHDRDEACHAHVAQAAVGAGVVGDACLADYTEDRATAMRLWLQQGKRF